MADKIATREAYGNALAEFGEKYDFVVLDADLAAATKTGIFKKKFPDRFFDCGIAEGNMISVAAGIATTGKTVFASSFAMFAAGRAFEQVRNSIGYPHLNVKIGATHAGITVIEGAAEGKGLGIRFLRHIERNSTLLFMVPANTENVKAEYDILLNELKKYNPELMDKARILAITKCDLVDDNTIKEIKKHLPKKVPHVFISSVVGKGIDELKDLIWLMLNKGDEEE